ncbi:DNA polymerase B family protein [Sphingomonas phage Eidolon]|uniref:DNA polymerase B family protein n=1 Tax=Sphingomonas phage Eidolon TaxID=2686311 RepID=A0A6M3T7Z8_9CAUD|nr:DNA polymerase B family protein [Sphingomonas phage Eidolon]QJD54408.1 DNA polymerase B family protein [Sphingomonas phage Eidolon]
MFFDDKPSPFALKRKRYSGPLRKKKYAPKYREYSLDPFNEFSAGDDVILDTECYRNYWLAMFKHVKTGKYFYLEQRGAANFAFGDALKYAMWFFRIISFNGNKYDLPMVQLAIQNADTSNLKDMSDEIIKEGKIYHNVNPGYNHIDIIEVAPLPDTSLKTYAARLHVKRMQELPIDEGAMLSLEDMDDIREYCCNDCDNTESLWHSLAGGIELREAMSAEYKTDLRSKSDAQVAEAVICTELKKLTGYWPKRPDFDENFEFQYTPPSFVRFQTPELQRALDTVLRSTFRLDKGGSPMMPEEIAGLKIKLGKSVYKMGMGGLHSTEKSTTHRADEHYALIDRDVASFYPFIILNNGYTPDHLGANFLAVFRTIVERRLEAKAKSKECKKAGDSAGARMWATISDGLKITINGTFGKLGSMYSALYSPKLLIQTTITGQLCILMLIEAVELAGLGVVSANTDGFVTKCPHSRVADFHSIIAQWEAMTNFETEETRYKVLASRDVNSYLAAKLKFDEVTKQWTDELEVSPGSAFADERAGIKSKGAGVYCERGSALNSPLSKNPEYLILNDALVAFIAEGKRFEDTIAECTDIKRFIAVKNVRGGGHQDGDYLGKVVRWYQAQGHFGEINYVLSGNKVGGTEGAKPLMELPDDIPNDLDRRWYVEKAYETLDKLGWHGNKTEAAELF